jgi:hypothetical protein
MTDTASTAPAWYCLRSRRKQEHIAAAHVRVLGDVTVFCPRIHFRRASRRGVVCVTEALFPGYFFRQICFVGTAPSGSNRLRRFEHRPVWQ